MGIDVHLRKSVGYGALLTAELFLSCSSFRSSMSQLYSFAFAGHGGGAVDWEKAYSKIER